MPSDTLPPDAELLTTKQAAQLCGVGERTYWRLAHDGRAPAPVKIGGSARYRRADLLAWIAAGCPHVDRREDGARHERT
jgi:excisionase family DNA binding protein